MIYLFMILMKKKKNGLPIGLRANNPNVSNDGKYSILFFRKMVHQILVLLILMEKILEVLLSIIMESKFTIQNLLLMINQ